MSKIEVFDPPLCCSTGVCGPAPDERLAVFSADLDWLKQQGVEVRRYNLAQEPTAFTGHSEVTQILQDTDGDGLPILVVGGQVVSQGDYPSRQRLAELVGLNGTRAEQDALAEDFAPPFVFDQRVAELVAIGAAIAANCEPCLKYHHRKAVELGLGDEDMISAVNVALQVKERPAQMMVRTAQRLLSPDEKPAGSCGAGPSNTQAGCCQ